MPPPPTPANQPSSSPNRTLWIILGSIGVVGVCSFLCLGIAVFGVLTALGSQTSAVFEQIQDDLDAEVQPAFQLPTSQPVDLGAAVPLGTAQRIGALEITVTDAQIINGEQGIQPDEYYQFVALDLRIQNTGAQPASLEGIGPWSWLQDSDEFTYDCCVFALSDPALLQDDLDAGAVVEGRLVYEADDATELFYWVYEDSTTGEQLVVELERLSAGTDMARSRR